MNEELTSVSDSPIDWIAATLLILQPSTYSAVSTLWNHQKVHEQTLLILCQTEARFPFKRNRLRCANENRKKRKRLRWQAANHGCHCFNRALLLAGACQRKSLRFLRFSFTQRTQRKQLRLNGNRAWHLLHKLLFIKQISWEYSVCQQTTMSICLWSNSLNLVLASHHILAVCFTNSCQRHASIPCQVWQKSLVCLNHQKHFFNN